MPCISLGEWQASETPGFLWDNSGGWCVPTHLFNIAGFEISDIGSRMPAPEDVDEDQGCSNKVYGLKPSSFLNHNHVRAI